jgi:hypothetical protein
MSSCKEQALNRIKLRETTYRRHVKLFDGKSPDWIEGFTTGFAYFLFHGLNRHLQDIENIETDLHVLRKAGIQFDEPLKGEWWDILEIKK